MTIIFTAIWADGACNALFASSSAPRLALVIGNADYSIQPLANPKNDAALMKDALEDVGFEVIHKTNVTHREFERSIVEYSRQLKAMGDDAVGLFYYAGHAVQANGENYLVPVDADITDELDLRIQAVDASTLLAAISAAGNPLNMVILDACRNNPYKAVSRSGTRGLAKLDAPSGTLIAYSTSPGKVAADGTGANSPYTLSLARSIRNGAVPVEQVFKQVRVRVMEKTGDQQVPWESSSLTGDFYFLEPKPISANEPRETKDDGVSGNSALDLAFWNTIKDSTDAGDFEAYLEQFPSGVFSPLARRRLAEYSDSEQVRSSAALSKCSGTFHTWWDETEITVNLQIANDGKASGTYDYEQGSIRGAMTGRLLIGRYSQQGNGQEGDISFKFDEDCNWFDGTWRNTTNFLSFSGPWKGCKDPDGDCPW